MKLLPSRMTRANVPKCKMSEMTYARLQEIPLGLHPLIYQLLSWVRDEGISMRSACIAAGVDDDTLGDARRARTVPQTSTLEHLGNLFGYRLGWVPIEEYEPQPSPKLRQRHPDADRRFAELKLTDRGHRLVRFITYCLIQQNVTLESVIEASGVSDSVVRLWRRGKAEPTLSNIEAVLNALGYELAVVPKGRGKDAGRSGGAARGVAGARQGEPDGRGSAERTQVA